MRRVAYALAASVALMVGALAPASAGCYGECNGYQDYRGGGGAGDYERPALSRDRTYGERSYDDGAALSHHLLRARPGILRRRLSSGRSIAAAITMMDTDGGYGVPVGYGDGTSLRRWLRLRRLATATVAATVTAAAMATVMATRCYGGGYSYDGYVYRVRLRRLSVVGYGGGYGYGGYGYGGGGYGGCHTAYIPYGWNWYRASSC